MRRLYQIFYLFSLIGLFCFNTVLAQQNTEENIHWMSWEEAMKVNKENPKKIFVDVYTDWCGYCKKMDASTFKDPSVISYINKHFHPIKLNGEQKEDIVHDEFTFKFVNSGRRGFHQFPRSLLNGRLSYPSFIFMDENLSRIMVSPGYRDAEKLLKELEYTASEAYKEKSFRKFISSSE